MSNNLKSILIAAMTLLLASACTSPEKLIEKGDFDKALIVSARKLSGKKKKKQKYVRAVEEAFRKVTNRDMRKAKALEAEGRPENWVEINRIYSKVKNRQNLIEPLLPLVDKEGYKADFQFVRVDGLLHQSKEKAAHFYYIEGKRLMAQAERGDKEAARDAYRQFEKIGQYFRSYKDEANLMRKAHDLGVTYVLFRMENNSNVLLPRDFEREIKRISVADLESKWRTVHLNAQAGRRYDYNVIMNFQHIEVSPGLIKERTYTDTRNIEDGWRYVLDQNGNVLKDSLGNDVKEPNFIDIYADVYESCQTKSAIVSGELEFIDNRTRQLFHREPITAEAIFENFAATFKGDQRALSKESKRKIGNTPLPFPTDENLVLQAADRLKPVIKQKIKRGLRG